VMMVKSNGDCEGRVHEIREMVVVKVKCMDVLNYAA